MADVSPLVSLTSDLLFEINREYPNVGSLDFSNNKISKIENMNVLQSLEELVLKGNLITVLENVEILSNLKRLDVSSNKIEKIRISPVYLNYSVEMIDLSDNCISDVQELCILCRGCKKLKEIKCSGNPFCENSTEYLDFLFKLSDSLLIINDNPRSSDLKVLNLPQDNIISALNDLPETSNKEVLNLTHLENQIKELRSANSSLMERNLFLETNISHISSELNKLALKNAENEGFKLKMEKELSNSCESAQSFELKVKLSEQAYRNLQSLQLSQETKLIDALQKLKHVEKQCSDFEFEREKYLNFLSEKEIELSKTIEDLKISNDNYSESVRDISSLKIQLLNLDLELKKEKELCLHTQLVVDSLNSRLKMADESCASMEETMVSLKISCSNFENQICDHRIRFSTLEEECAKLKSASISNLNQISALEAERNSLLRSNSLQKDQISSLQQMIDVLESRFSSTGNFETVSVDNVSMLNHYRVNLFNTLAEKAQVDFKLSKLQSLYDAEIKDLKERNNVLQLQFNTSQNEVKILTENHFLVQSKYNQVSLSFRKLLEHIQPALENLHGRITTFSALTLSNLTSSDSRLTFAHQRVQTIVALQSGKLKKCAKNLSADESDRSIDNISLQQKLSVTERERDRLQQERLSLVKQLQDFSQKYAEELKRDKLALETELQAVKQHNKELNSQSLINRESIANLESSLRIMDVQLSDCKVLIQDEAKSKKQLLNELQEKKSEIDSINKEYTKLLSTYRVLSIENIENKSDPMSQKMQNRIQQLEAELRAAQTNVASLQAQVNTFEKVIQYSFQKSALNADNYVPTKQATMDARISKLAQLSSSLLNDT